MVMQIRFSNIKTVIALTLSLCLAMLFLSPVASASIMANHTHVCQDEEYKEICIDVRDCCTICINLNEAKYRSQYLYGNIAKPHNTYMLQTGQFALEAALICTVPTTLVSLKVRLDN